MKIGYYSIEQWRKISLLAPIGGQGRSHFHDYCNGFAGAFSAGLAPCHLIKPKKNNFLIQINYFDCITFV